MRKIVAVLSGIVIGRETVIEVYRRILQILLQNGRGHIHEIVMFTYNDHYRPTNAMWVHDPCTFFGIVMSKT